MRDVGEGGREPPQRPAPPGAAEEGVAYRQKPPPERKIAALAARQSGVVSSAQLRAAGIGGAAVRRRVEAGRLHPLHRGVYAVGHRGISVRARHSAALLAYGRGAVLTHWSAAWAYGLVPEADLIHLTVLGGDRKSRRGIRFHRLSRLTRSDIRSREGLPVTSAARTLLDLSSLASFDRLTRLYNDARVARLVRDSDLADLLHRCKGHRGAPALRLLHAQGAPGPTRSVAEDRFLSLVRAAGLPLPQVNANALGLEVDFLWPDHRLIAEIDGYRFHSTPAAFETDRARDARLVAAGFGVLRLSWSQITLQSEATVARLAAALAA